MKKIWIIFSLVIISMFVAACGTSTGEAVRFAKSTRAAVLSDVCPSDKCGLVTKEGLLNTKTLTNQDETGVNCNTICLNAQRTCIGAYLGIEHDLANVGEEPEPIREWVPVDCFAESQGWNSNPLSCRCY